MKDEWLQSNKQVTPSSVRSHDYSWGELTQMVVAHRRELIAANLIAVCGAIASVPVPLLIPLLVDEVLLDKPGVAISVMNSLFPLSWHGPVLHILAIAHEAGVDFTMKDIGDLSTRTPNICKVAPSGTSSAMWAAIRCSVADGSRMGMAGIGWECSTIRSAFQCR